MLFYQLIDMEVSSLLVCRFARQYYVILLAMLLIFTAYVFLAFLVNFRTSYYFCTGGGGDGYNFSTVLR